MSWSKGFRRTMIITAALAGALAAAPLAAQEPIIAEPSPIEPLAVDVVRPGPRVPTDWRSLEPQMRREPSPHYRAQHTIVISTLALVVIVVLLVLLIT